MSGGERQARRFVQQAIDASGLADRVKIASVENATRHFIVWVEGPAGTRRLTISHGSKNNAPRFRLREQISVIRSISGEYK